MQLQFLTSHSPYYARAQRLYLAAFPAQERRDEANMLPCSAAFRPAIALTDEGFCGILFFWESRDFLFLEHFAIEPQLRNRGLGAKALALLKGLGKPVILEIELPEDGLTRRRKLFYERNGFRENPWHHIQPKYRPEDGDLPLMLLSYPQPVDGAVWQAFEAFLEENVACAPRKDPQIPEEG